ncbi:hypothetical protein ACFWQL_04210 [Amycolatopsis thermoflava]|uniref:hypothetical protein n=1 Tax=Amycolatopsis TaxID=1813 RepID=UPI00365C4CBC
MITATQVPLILVRATRVFRGRDAGVGAGSPVAACGAAGPATTGAGGAASCCFSG